MQENLLRISVKSGSFSSFLLCTNV